MLSRPIPPRRPLPTNTDHIDADTVEVNEDDV